jgi:hypothetical protein
MAKEAKGPSDLFNQQASPSPACAAPPAGWPDRTGSVPHFVGKMGRPGYLRGCRGRGNSRSKSAGCLRRREEW